MPVPEDYTSIMAPEDSRDEARRVKDDRDESWGDFLEAAAEELDTES